MATDRSDVQPKPSHVTQQRIGVVGDAGVGKTTVATLIAHRFGERTNVTVTGETRQFLEADSSAPEGGLLGVEWILEDLPAGTEAFEDRVGVLDTAFVIATPDRLDSVAAYERVADRTDTDLFLLITRFTEDDRDALRAFEGPELAEYFYEDGGIERAMANGNEPPLDDWTVEAPLMEALAPERVDRERALELLDSGQQSFVNVEVDDSEAATELIEAFEAAGHRAAYFRCNCQCHDGHVLARPKLR